MHVTTEEHRLLYRVAHAYYVGGQTQQQIARRFGLSRPTISRMLQKARDLHIVNITLVPPASSSPDIEDALERRYGLEEVIVVAVTDPDDPGLVARELGPAAADCLLRCLDETGILGLAWGRSVLAVIEALPSHPLPDLTVVQLSGGLGPVGTLEHSTELARLAAQKLAAQLRLIPAPGIVSSSTAAEVLRSDYQIREVLSVAAHADVALVGLGVPTHDSVLLSNGNIVTEEDLAALEAAGAVGDVVLRYIDTTGTPLDVELDERIVGVTLEQLSRIPRVIGVAGGTVKHEVVRAALRGGLLDVLVTDHATAEALLAGE